MRNIKLTIEYKGTNYLGFQKQPKGPTIQGELEKALEILLKERAKVVGASRTDAGVHATGQVVNFRTSSRMEGKRIKSGLNGILPEDIVVKEALEVPISFHARRDAILREYCYLIWNESYPSVLKKEFVYFVPQPLNLGAMRQALKDLIGTYDFTSFCVASSSVKGCTRTVKEAAIEKKGQLFLIRIQADAFVHQMVRSIVGTLIEIGLGKRKPEEMGEILESKDRRKAGKTAPAHALILTEVRYENVHN